MMKIRRGTRLSKGLAVFLAAALVLMTASIVVTPLLSSFMEHRRAVIDARLKLQHYQDVASRLPSLTSSLARLKAENAASGSGFLDGRSADIAAASLQASVRQILESASAKLLVLEATALIPEGDFMRTSVRVQITTDVIGLKDILDTLESGNPKRFIEDLSVTVPEENRNGGDNEYAKTLRVSMTVYGYWRPTHAL